MARTNRFANPSYEVDVVGLAFDGADTASVTRVSGAGDALVGTWAAEWVLGATPGAATSLRQEVAGAVTPGEWVAAVTPVRCEGGTAWYRTRVTFYNGVTLVSSSGFGDMLSSSASYVEPSVAALVPATANRAVVELFVYSSVGGAAPTAALVSTTDAWIAAVAGTESQAAMNTAPYFDGSSTDTSVSTYTWTGTPGSSTSLETATLGLYVSRAPDAGAPQAAIIITGLSEVSTSVITVQTSWDGGERWHDVRGAVAETVQGTAFFRDYVPALNVPVLYRVLVLSGPGFLDPLRTQVELTIPEPWAWLQDPLDPRTAVKVATQCPPDGGLFLVEGSLAESVLSQTTDIVTPMDANYGVAAIGRRAMASRVPMRFAWRTAAENGAFRRLLMQSGQVVARGLPNDVLEPVAHLAMGAASEDRTTRKTHEVSIFSFQVNQVRPLSIRVVIPWWTYEQVRMLWAATPDNTYAEVVAARPGLTYADWQRDPEPV
jgi:hypothetical protein